MSRQEVCRDRLIPVAGCKSSPPLPPPFGAPPAPVWQTPGCESSRQDLENFLGIVGGKPEHPLQRDTSLPAILLDMPRLACGMLEEVGEVRSAPHSGSMGVRALIHDSLVGALH